MIFGIHYQTRLQTWREAAMEGAEKKAKVRKCIVRAQNSVLAAAWGVWAQHAIGRAIQRRKCAVVLARLSQGLTARGFQGWREALDFQKRARSVMMVSHWPGFSASSELPDLFTLMLQ